MKKSTSKLQQIQKAYINGWSRKDLAQIFKTSERQIINATKGMSIAQRDEHRGANRVRRERINAAALAERTKNGGKIKDIKKEFHKESLENSKAYHGTRKKVYKSKMTTLTAYLEPEVEDYDL